jgi:hypothetical protein
MREGYSVTVSKLGEPILTIERRMLSGKSELSDEDEQAIRDAAEHLRSFVGPPPSERKTWRQWLNEPF